MKFNISETILNFKLNFKTITAIGTSALMIGMTMGMAAA